MASASSSSARSLFAESRSKLVERVASNVESCGSVCRQVVRGSRSHDTLLAAARATAAQVSTRSGGSCVLTAPPCMSLFFVLTTIGVKVV